MLRNLGGGRHESAQLVPLMRNPLGAPGALLPWKITENRVFLVPFPAF